MNKEEFFDYYNDSMIRQLQNFDILIFFENLLK